MIDYYEEMSNFGELRRDRKDKPLGAVLQPLTSVGLAITTPKMNEI